MKILFFFFLLIISYTFTRELVYVQVMTRHGAKIPDHPISPTDRTVWNCTLNTLDYFSEDNSETVRLDRIYRKRYMRNRQQILGNCSEGQLSSFGSQQHFINGQNFRQKYIEQNKFLSPTFSPQEIYIRSTDMDRTIHSAQSLMKGLYPEINSTQIQTIMIDTCNLNADNLYFDSCVKMINKCESVMKSTAWKNLLEKYEQLHKHIATSLDSKLEFYEYLEFFQSIIAHKIPLPPGINMTIVDLVYNISATQMGMLYSSLEVTKLGLGVFITDFLTDLQQSTSNTSSTKFSLYSAHDVTVGQLLNLLNVFNQNPIWPPFAAHVVFEYWKENDGDIYVQLFYQGQQLTLPFCGSLSCSLTSFVSYLKNVSLTFSQYNIVCADSSRGGRGSNIYGDTANIIKALC